MNLETMLKNHKKSSSLPKKAKEEAKEEAKDQNDIDRLANIIVDRLVKSPVSVPVSVPLSVSDHKNFDDDDEIKDLLQMSNNPSGRDYVPHNKIVICLSRSLNFSELVLLNKLFSCLTFKNEFHGAKSAKNLLFEVLLLDFTVKENLKWYLRNKSYLYSHCNIINVQIARKSLGNVQINALKKTFGFSSVVKQIGNEFISGSKELLENMLIDHQSLPMNTVIDKIYRCCQGTKKKK
jgi:hypothetical protein